MDQHQFVNVTRTLVKRGVTDFERKVVAFFVCGAAGDAALNILGAYHVTLPAMVAPLIPWGCGAIGGYLTHSLGSVTTVHTSPGGVTEVSTSTGSVKVPAAFLPQPPQPAPPVVSTPLPAPPLPSPAPVDPVPDEVPDRAGEMFATSVIDPNDRYRQFLAKLPSSTGEQDLH